MNIMHYAWCLGFMINEKSILRLWQGQVPGLLGLVPGRGMCLGLRSPGPSGIRRLWPGHGPSQPGQVPGEGIGLGLTSPGPSGFLRHWIADGGGDNFKAPVI